MLKKSEIEAIKDTLFTPDGEPYDPKRHFIKQRNGKLFVYDRQVLNWKRYRKSKGELKNSITKRHVKQTLEQKMRKMFE